MECARGGAFDALGGVAAAWSNASEQTNGSVEETIPTTSSG